jgi:hypothetical protein
MVPRQKIYEDAGDEGTEEDRRGDEGSMEDMTSFESAPDSRRLLATEGT